MRSLVAEYYLPGFVRELYECILRTHNTKKCEPNFIRYFHDESCVVRLFLGLCRFVNITRCKINTVSTITVQSLRVQSIFFTLGAESLRSFLVRQSGKIETTPPKKYLFLKTTKRVARVGDFSCDLWCFLLY